MTDLTFRILNFKKVIYLSDNNRFIIDEEVKEYIKNKNRDYRVCTTCSGPMILPIEIKPFKPTDLKVQIGDNTLYVSAFMARYINRIDKHMLDRYRMYEYWYD
ncbi:MAG: hypothetical protein ACE5KE_14215 [Methanosarcinales archaeon]